jgi:hypothetical protein
MKLQKDFQRRFVIWKPLFDLMLSGRRYLLCTCITELELAIPDAMSVEREFWAGFELQSYSDMHN